MRLFSLIVVVGFSIAGLAALWAGAVPTDNPAQREVSLLGILAEWKYPGSKMLGGASMADGGNPLLQSVKCQAILTTADPVKKVIEFYEAKVKDADAKSVATQDDSQGRPVTLRVIAVNKVKTSTTLVISRTEGEKETHIAWSHYLRLAGKP